MKRNVIDGVLILEGVKKPVSGEPNKLTMRSKADTGAVHVTLDGVITSEMQDDFADELLAYVSKGLNLRLDMEKVTYIAPAVIEKMIRLQCDYIERLGLQMLLVSMSQVLLEWFRKNHYSQQFSIQRRI